MKKIIRFFVFLLVLAAAMVILKPSSHDFESWVKEDAARKRGKAKGENIVEKLVDKGVTTANQLQLLATYRYDDHVVIATVEAVANGEKVQFVGIVGTWIKLP